MIEILVYLLPRIQSTVWPDILQFDFIFILKKKGKMSPNTVGSIIGVAFWKLNEAFSG